MEEGNDGDAWHGLLDTITDNKPDITLIQITKKLSCARFVVAGRACRISNRWQICLLTFDSLIPWRMRRCWVRRHRRRARLSLPTSRRRLTSRKLTWTRHVVSSSPTASWITSWWTWGLLNRKARASGSWRIVGVRSIHLPARIAIREGQWALCTEGYETEIDTSEGRLRHPNHRLVDVQSERRLPKHYFFTLRLSGRRFSKQFETRECESNDISQL